MSLSAKSQKPRAHRIGRYIDCVLRQVAEEVHAGKSGF